MVESEQVRSLRRRNLRPEPVEVDFGQKCGALEVDVEQAHQTHHANVLRQRVVLLFSQHFGEHRLELILFEFTQNAENDEYHFLGVGLGGVVLQVVLESASDLDVQALQVEHVQTAEQHLQSVVADRGRRVQHFEQDLANVV